MHVKWWSESEDVRQQRLLVDELWLLQPIFLYPVLAILTSDKYGATQKQIAYQQDICISFVLTIIIFIVQSKHAWSSHQFTYIDEQEK
jgi:hypothetical protein